MLQTGLDWSEKISEERLLNWGLNVGKKPANWQFSGSRGRAQRMDRNKVPALGCDEGGRRQDEVGEGGRGWVPTASEAMMNSWEFLHDAIQSHWVAQERDVGWFNWNK